MQQDKDLIPMWPEQASSLAWDVDLFYAAMIAISVFLTVLIGGVLIYFAVKYRRRDGDYRPPHVETSKALELAWTIVPLFIVVGMFVWGAELFFRQTTIPENALSIDATGKQWMFKFQHPNGRREINSLHVPLGQPVKLTMATEDVIHDLFIPAFRIKKDLVPGRYTSTWFEATKPGVYHMFCNQYCGTLHSDMIGRVVVMHPTEYQNWLSGYTGQTPVEAGEALFTKFNCNTCHATDGSGGRGPSLVGLFGGQVQLADGKVVEADREYIRQSILKPQEQIVAGYTPIMPSFQGVLNEEQVGQLIAYIESLNTQGGTAAAAGAGTSQQQQQAQGQHGAQQQQGQQQQQQGQQRPAAPDPEGGLSREGARTEPQIGQSAGERVTDHIGQQGPAELNKQVPQQDREDSGGYPPPTGQPQEIPAERSAPGTSSKQSATPASEGGATTSSSAAQQAPAPASAATPTTAPELQTSALPTTTPVAPAAGTTSSTNTQEAQ